MIDLTIEIEGERQVSAELLGISRRTSDLREPLSRIANELLKTFDLNFSTRGATLGEPWKPRKPQMRRGARYDLWPLLEKTSAMRNSFYSDVTRMSAVIGNRADYFKYHQSNQARSRLPRRLMMKIDETRRLFIIKTIQAYLMGQQ